MRVWGLRYFSIGVALTLSFAACGGASGTEFFDNAGSGQPSNSPGASDSGKGDGGAKDGGGNTASDASWPDASPNSNGILCGDIERQQPTYCQRAKEYCCITTLVTTPVRACLTRDLSLCAGLKAGCDSANDCGEGEVCCGTFENATTRYTSLECAARDRCVGDGPPGTSYVVFCDPNAKEDECASTGDTCIASASIKGYFVCGP